MSFKDHTVAVLQEIHSTAPQIVQDGLVMLAGEGVAGGAIAAVKPVAKAAAKSAVMATAGATKALKPAAKAVVKHADEVVRATVAGVDNVAAKIVTKLDNVANKVANKVDDFAAKNYEFFRLNLPQQSFARAGHAASKAAGHAGKFADNVPANPLKQTLLREAVEVTADGASKAAGHVDDLADDVVKHKPKKIPANQKPLDLEKILAKVDDSVKVETSKLLELENALLKECRDGVRVRGDFQNHHMVSKESDLLKGHKIWELVDVDIESPLNKVLLPNKKGLHPTRSIHNGAHTEFNRQRIIDALDEVLELGRQNNWNRQEYNAAFQKFLLDERKGLIEGTIDLYAKGA